MRMTPVSSTVKSGVVMGNVPAVAGTLFLEARLPAMAIMGMIIMKRPKNIATPSE
jgi:hypothetical protein